ncbi:MAG: rRNA maturation RNase YbeY [Candidatus Omnitrophota bacterium]|nr:rRNA maturation RNase YbeY [Candidatus Omnitrophota bacterium]
MKIEITNKQDIKKINIRRLKGQVSKILKVLNVRRDVSILLCANDFIKKLNKKFFAKGNPTDVISFFLEDVCVPGYLGEVIVSVQEAVIKGKEYANSWQKEMVLYIIHGILHLIGYDDQTKKDRLKMEKKQNQVIALLFSNTIKKL